MRQMHIAGLGLACALAVTSPVRAQTEPSADSVARLLARLKTVRRAQADTARATVGPRMTEALRGAGADKKAVLVYIADTVAGSSSRVFEHVVHSAALGRRLRDAFVFVRLTRAESDAIRGNPGADSTRTDSTLRTLAQSELSVVDSAGQVSRLPVMVGGTLMELWTASRRLQQLAPRLTEADRQRLVDYLMLWARGN